MAQQPQQKPAGAAKPVVRSLKRGEILFNEGDPSRSMYYVQSGTLRLFKRKGTASVELGLIHKGEVIGEMGFLDGGARSASAEAIHETDLVEITNANLAEQLKVLPPWLMVLLKTVVNRLRSANNKIRQLEGNSMAYTYGSGGVSTTYQFLSIYDVLKISTGLLLTGARNGEPGPGGSIRCTMAKVNRYANQIMGIHTNKIVEFMDILERADMVKLDRAVLDKITIDILDIDQLETLVSFINEENLKEHSKKISFSVKAVTLMGFIVKHMELFPASTDGTAQVNLAKIIELEKPNHNGKPAFGLEEAGELAKAKLSTEVAMKDSNNINITIQVRQLVKMYRIQKVIKEVEILNDKRHEKASRGKH